MRTVMAGVVACCIAGAICSGALAQATNDVDIVTEGRTMQNAVSQGDAAQAFEHAQRIVQAVGGELDGRSADELYWIGMAHMYLMAQTFDLAREQGLSGGRAELAAKMSGMVLRPSVEEVRVISHGQEVDLSDYAVEGQTVIFDFYSKYCGPCVRISPFIKQLAEERDDILAVKIDINRPGHRGIDWESPVARQYNLRSIPHFKIYGPDGTLQAEGDEARQMIFEWLEALEE